MDFPRVSSGEVDHGYWEFRVNFDTDIFLRVPESAERLRKAMDVVEVCAENVERAVLNAWAKDHVRYRARYSRDIALGDHGSNCPTCRKIRKDDPRCA